MAGNPKTYTTSSTGNAWIGSAGAGGIDLRSDTMTTPTAAMLQAIEGSTLLDDVFQEDTTTAALESYCAELAGKEAGLFVLSGTMGNQVALRSLLTQPPHSVLCDTRSHIYHYEAGGVSSLSQAMLIPVVPSNGVHLTLEDVQQNAILSDDIHACPTRVVSLENTLNGMVMPLDEAQRISAWAREHKIHVHCDGARLWEAASTLPDPKTALRDYAACFDTISLCFSKGLGAPVGSILVGPADVLRHARWIRKSIGGGLRQPGPLAAAARVAVDDVFVGGKLRASHQLASDIAKLWSDKVKNANRDGDGLLYPVQTNMVWLDLDSVGVDATRFAELGKAEGLKLYGDRLVIHYQIYENRNVVLPKLESVFQSALKEAGEPVQKKTEAKTEETNKTVSSSANKSMYPTK